mmetsp:Transcript_54231/g.118722  ORF Transcript_54231/g.118722 Transcript_54231/m.118722 type:complete len:213 (-) Transcript_54231:334-972(-)
MQMVCSGVLPLASLRAGSALALKRCSKMVLRPLRSSHSLAVRVRSDMKCKGLFRPKCRSCTLHSVGFCASCCWTFSTSRRTKASKKASFAFSSRTLRRICSSKTSMPTVPSMSRRIKCRSSCREASASLTLGRCCSSAKAPLKDIVPLNSVGIDMARAVCSSFRTQIRVRVTICRSIARACSWMCCIISPNLSISQHGWPFKNFGEPQSQGL